LKEPPSGSFSFPPHFLFFLKSFSGGSFSSFPTLCLAPFLLVMASSGNLPPREVSFSRRMQGFSHFLLRFFFFFFFLRFLFSPGRRLSFQVFQVFIYGRHCGGFELFSRFFMPGFPDRFFFRFSPSVKSPLSPSVYFFVFRRLYDGFPLSFPGCPLLSWDVLPVPINALLT